MSSITPTLQLNPDTSPESQRNKRRKTHHPDHQTTPIADHQAPKRWRTPTEQQIYSSNLLHALRRTSSSSPSSPRIRGIRDVADRVLATSARGTTRWSRAILTARLKKHKRVKVPGGRKIRKPGLGREKAPRLPPVEKRIRVLSRLVPGCRKLSFSNLLEEATDYIAALEMQVRAMTALTQLLTGSSSTSTSTSTSSS